MTLPDLHMTMRYCRMCGTPLRHVEEDAYRCQNGHAVYANSIPAAGIILVNDAKEVLLLQRSYEPFKGTYNIPGGVCGFGERAEDAAMREVQEETGITPDQYEAPQFVCTGIDASPLQEEVLAVLVVIFTAKLKGDVTLRLDSESLGARFVPLAELDLGTIRFPAVRQALQQVKDTLA